MIQETILVLLNQDHCKETDSYTILTQTEPRLSPLRLQPRPHNSYKTIVLFSELLKR